MNHIDRKYILLMSSRLERFKECARDLYRFRCPFCGDSKKKKSKTRGEFFNFKNDAVFKCHNCEVSLYLPNFLKTFDSTLFKEYLFEKLRSSFRPPQIDKSISDESFSTKTLFDHSEKIIPALEDHPEVLQYVLKRKIPESIFQYLGSTENLNEISSKIEKYKDTKFPEGACLIIPFIQNGFMTHLQARYLNNEKIRYVTLTINNSEYKIWGKDNVNPEEPIYITEGPIDAMCVHNAIAMAGLTIQSAVQFMKTEFPMSDYFFILDNESTPQINAYKRKILEMKKGMFIYPKGFCCKDINESIERGFYDEMKINNLIRENSFSGLRLQLEMTLNTKRSHHA